MSYLLSRMGNWGSIKEDNSIERFKVKLPCAVVIDRYFSAEGQIWCAMLILELKVWWIEWDYHSGPLLFWTTMTGCFRKLAGAVNRTTLSHHYYCRQGRTLHLFKLHFLSPFLPCFMFKSLESLWCVCVWPLALALVSPRAAPCSFWRRKRYFMFYFGEILSIMIHGIFPHL